MFVCRTASARGSVVLMYFSVLFASAVRCYGGDITIGPLQYSDVEAKLVSEAAFDLDEKTTIDPLGSPSRVQTLATMSGDPYPINHRLPTPFASVQYPSGGVGVSGIVFDKNASLTAQLLYETGGPAYLNPDVTARFDSVCLSAEGKDRVRISGVRGDSPPATAKAALNYSGGWRSTLTLYLTGLDIEEKAALVERALWAAIPGGRDAFDAVEVSLLRTDKPDPATNAEAMAQLRITVKAADERTVGRAFSARVTELALASYPGMFGDGLTGGARAFGVYWPTAVPAVLLPQQVVIGGDTTVVEPVLPPDPPVRAEVPAVAVAATPGGPVVRAPLGRVAGARSGDKGGNANLGV